MSIYLPTPLLPNYTHTCIGLVKWLVIKYVARSSCTNERTNEWKFHCQSVCVWICGSNLGFRSSNKKHVLPSIHAPKNGGGILFLAIYQKYANLWQIISIMFIIDRIFEYLRQLNWKQSHRQIGKASEGWLKGLSILVNRNA